MPSSGAFRPPVLHGRFVSPMNITHRIRLILAASALLLGGIFLVFSEFYVPLGFAASESLTFFSQSYNLRHRPVRDSCLLTDDGLNPNPQAMGSAALYTHNLNFQRVIGVIILQLGFANLRTFTYCAILLGSLAILLLIYNSSRDAATTLLLLGILFFNLLQYFSLGFYLNGFRIWSFVAFFALLFLLIRKPAPAAWLAVTFAMPLYEDFTPVFLSVAGIIYLILHGGRDRKNIIYMVAGPVLGFAFFAALLVCHYGWHGLAADWVTVYKARESDSARFVPFQSLLRMYSDLHTSEGVTPVSRWDAVRHLLAATRSHNGVVLTGILVASTAYAFCIVARQFGKQADDDSAGLLLLSRLHVACLLAGIGCLCMFRGYVQVIYLFYAQPMWNFFYATGFLLFIPLFSSVLAVALQRTGWKWRGQGAALILILGLVGSFNIRVYQRYPFMDDRGYFALAAAAKSALRLYSTAPTPFNYLDWGATGLEPIYIGKSDPTAFAADESLQQPGSLINIIDSHLFIGYKDPAKWLAHSKQASFRAKAAPFEIFSGDSQEILMIKR
jgi:hypothetical protein